ncbi:unnamed protein product [Rotaria socialis]|uniref:Uncharacterized protein n=2 Tax=Rotaria socialis TaxID=392032 RepID=A0A819WA96_9BILA|nr:unnamed protein product [Rotaria socialis]CAF3479782.1 unnamed protein product [Rotaria socialis]CAF3676009.1 unnamed protein product [Rotaria socialis]CAF3712718.1 unnamed protein product [Rotaria socialis]CAF4121921.1 unnamed protein product [Rotaria socialis]
MHFYCQCLNVTIDVLEINDSQETQTNVLANELKRFVNLKNGWLECKIATELAIHIVWQNLFQSISLRDMKLNRCLGCNQYTHLTNMNMNRILINKDLLNDKTVKRAYLDPNYSQITKIVLPPRVNSSPRMASSQDETCQRECELVQQIYRQSIADADREIEEKIQIYQREQEQILDKKTKVIYKELDHFLRFMRTIPRQVSSNKTSPVLQTSSSYINENSMESGLGSDIFDANGADFSRQSSTFERAFSERTSNLDEDTIDDPMFENTDWFSGKDSLPNFATSLPKEIAFRSCAISQQNENDSNDLERIGKSFRELSQSLMCTDGTEVFGDLPSPRLNSQPT